MSIEKREFVVESVKNGKSTKYIASSIGVHEKTINRIWKIYLLTGTISKSKTNIPLKREKYFDDFIKFALDNKYPKEFWNNVVFADEKWFSISEKNDSNLWRPFHPQ